MTDPTGRSFTYVTYIRTTPERLWEALTTPAFMRQYWFGIHAESDWKAGGPWRLVFEDGRTADAGTIVAAEPPRRLEIDWANEWKPELKAEGFSRCTIELEPLEGTVKLTVTHTSERPQSRLIEAVSGGWPKILSNLKSLLETGTVAVAR